LIAGIGIDLATVSRISKVHQRYGLRFARRFLHDAELSQYNNHQNKDRFLSKRFAVKEAAVKALGTGERAGVLLKDFYLEHDELGKPILLSDEGDTVAAFVVLERESVFLIV